MDDSQQDLPYDLHASPGVPIKAWTRGVPVEHGALVQLRKTAMLPFVHGWVAVMPDVHVGIGATVGSVIPTKGAIVPAAVGVDLGCGMIATRTTLTSHDLPTGLAENCDGFDDLLDPSEDAWLQGGPDGVAEPVSPAPVGAQAAGPDLDLDGCRDAVVLATDPYVESGLGMPRWPLALPPSDQRATAFLLIDDTVWARAPYAAPSAFRYVGGRLEGSALPDATFGDVNGDGWDDAIRWDGMATWWGRGSSFERAALPALGERATVLGDVDGDGDDEVLTATAARTWIMRGGPAFPDEGTLATLVEPEAPAFVGFAAPTLGDVDGDGRVDLVGFGTLGHVWLARDLVTGDGVARPAYGSPPRAYPGIMPSDVDGDGLDDLVLADALSVRVHPGRRDAAPDPEAWEISLPDAPSRLGPDGLLLPIDPTGRSLSMQRLTPEGPRDHAFITVPVSVRGAHFEGRLLVLPRAEADGARVYRVRRGALEGPTLVTLPPGIPMPRPLTYSPSSRNMEAR